MVDPLGGIEGGGVVFTDLQSLVDAYDDAPYISLVVRADDQLTILASNRRTRALAGDRPLLGLPVTEALSDIERQGGVLEVYQRVARTGVVESVTGWQAHFQNPDGSRNAIWFDLTVTPLVSAGTVVAVVGRAWDVTERVVEKQRVDSELRAAETSLLSARQVVDALQRAMLPDRVPVLPHLDVAAGYLLAAQEQAAGGDWFDVVVRHDRVVLVVGDVVGHGVAASAAMGQLRAVLLSQLRAGDPIVDSLAVLDRWARWNPEAEGTTVCLVEIEPVTGSFEYVTAGHPPPLVVDGDGGNSRFLAPTGDGPLGGHRERATKTGTLSLGELVVLYSDGLVELPGTTPAQATVALAAVTADAVADTLLPVDAPSSAAQRVTQQAIELLVRVRGHADDITVVQRNTGSRRWTSWWMST